MSFSIFSLSVLSVSAYSLNIESLNDGTGVNITNGDGEGVNINSNTSGSGVNITGGGSSLDITGTTNTTGNTLNITGGGSSLDITGTTNTTNTGNTLNVTGSGSSLNLTGSTGGSNTGSVQIQSDPRDVYDSYRDAYQDVRDEAQEYRDAAQDFRDGNLKVTTAKDGSVTLKSQNGALMITTDESGSSSEIKISGTPSKLSIIAQDPETRRLTLSSVASMNGDAHLLIQDDSDLRIYSDYVIEAEPRVKKVTYGDNTVEISYKQDARFLGIFGTYLNGKIVADTYLGKVEVKLPWYSFLFVKDNTPDETVLTSTVSGGLNNNNSLSITSGGNTLQIGAQRNAKATGLIISAF